MNLEQLKRGFSQFGSPLYIFDIDILTKEMNRISKGLGSDIGLCYAMKANPFVTEHMAALTGRIEICSMGEYQICRELSIPPDKMLISGVMKKREDIEQIFAHCKDKPLYTIESKEQFQIFRDLCRENKIPIRVYLRLSSGNQFGMDEETVQMLIAEIDTDPYLMLEGIHYFSGTQKRSIKQIQKELTYLDDFLLSLETTNMKIKSLEYGPGLSVDYFKNQNKGLIADNFLQELSDIIAAMKWDGHITLEMGRAMTAMCGYYLTQIRDVKKTGDKNFCIVDGGLHQMNYDGQIKGMHLPHIMVSPQRTEGQLQDWTICGSLCTVNDVLCQKLPITNPQVDDLLVFERTGAYSVTEGMALFLSHEFPAVALYSKAMGWSIVREEQQSYKLNLARR